MTVSANDKLEINELCARLYRSVDGNDAKGFAVEFAPNGVFVSRYGEFTGMEEIWAFMEHHISEGNETGVRHFITNQTIEAFADDARLRFYILKMNVAEGPAAIASASGDCIVGKTAQGWRFKRFELTIDPAVFENNQPA